MDVSQQSGAPADQVEETPGRASLEKLGCRTPPQLHAGGVGRQQLIDLQRSPIVQSLLPKDSDSIPQTLFVELFISLMCWKN